MQRSDFFHPLCWTWTWLYISESSNETYTFIIRITFLFLISEANTRELETAKEKAKEQRAVFNLGPFVDAYLAGLVSSFMSLHTAGKATIQDYPLKNSDSHAKHHACVFLHVKQSEVALRLWLKDFKFCLKQSCNLFFFLVLGGHLGVSLLKRAGHKSKSCGLLLTVSLVSVTVLLFFTLF